MWSPRTAAEVFTAISDGSLPHEAASFEVKAQLSVKGKNSEIAVDVAAMATYGGVIIYGIEED